jgi:hypothetical protein
VRALFIAQCRGCPRNCKRRASDGFTTENAHVLGKVVGGDEPRARRPATAGVTRARIGRGVSMSSTGRIEPLSGESDKAAVRGDELLPASVACHEKCSPQASVCSDRKQTS